MEKIVEKFFNCMGSQKKFQILNELLKKEMTHSELSKSLNIEKSLLSHHLKDLIKAKFVKAVKKGKQTYYHLPEKIKILVTTQKILINKYIIYYKAS